MVLHTKNKSKEIMKPGMVFTIEPIFCLNKINKVVMWKDNFTVISPFNPSA